MLAISDLYGSTKLTVSFPGIAEGVGGLDCIKERGVLGGSRLGATFFHDSTKASSTFASATGSSENHRIEAQFGRREATEGRRRRAVAWRYMVGGELCPASLLPSPASSSRRVNLF